MKSAQTQWNSQGKGNFRNEKCPNTMKFSVKRELSQWKVPKRNAIFKEKGTFAMESAQKQ
ncbi:hypothetical protein MTP04_10520 [Lysinibacillus sp. PLM2]|nr:hypothetical protein MTP04_10520 [Lysinibacillus sp. PLM2]